MYTPYGLTNLESMEGTIHLSYILSDGWVWKKCEAAVTLDLLTSTDQEAVLGTWV